MLKAYEQTNSIPSQIGKAFPSRYRHLGAALRPEDLPPFDT